MRGREGKKAENDRTGRVGESRQERRDSQKIEGERKSEVKERKSRLRITGQGGKVRRS